MEHDDEEEVKIISGKQTIKHPFDFKNDLCHGANGHGKGFEAQTFDDEDRIQVGLRPWESVAGVWEAIRAGSAAVRWAGG